ncbi:MAG: L-lysine 6-transaminase [Bacteroidetes bacterium]|nr:L-lysine 6-transaminase [Bacteroidota bacterium]
MTRELHETNAAAAHNSHHHAGHGVQPDQVHSTLAHYMLADGFDLVLDLERSQGPYLYDAATGKRYLDFFTFFASNPVGMNHPEMRTPEFIRKIGTVALHKPSCSDVYTVEMAEFVSTFFRVAVPEYFKYSFFIEGGTLAVENALKVAFDWKVQKNFHNGYQHEHGHLVLHLRHAFHGRSGYALSLTNTDPTKTNYFPKFTDWPRVCAPAASFPLEGKNLEETIAREEQSLAEIRKAFAENPDAIACIILEPIQGEGGDNHFRPEYLAQLRAICDQEEALLIFDEVQTGVGMTGTMWAHEALGVRPDIMSFGKKSQVCGILATDRIDDIPNHAFHKSSRINSTWGGNLVDMVRFTKFLEIIEEENLVRNARTVGGHLMTRLAELTAEYPGLVSNARGRGLFCAVDIATAQERDLLRQKCYDKGLLILGCGDRSIRFRPALNITAAQIDEGMAMIREAIGEIVAGI